MLELRDINHQFFSYTKDSDEEQEEEEESDDDNDINNEREEEGEEEMEGSDVEVALDKITLMNSFCISFQVLNKSNFYDRFGF